MFGPWFTTKQWFRKYMPAGLSALKPNANFITLHYCYILTWTLVCSVILYGNRRLSYIDALFFASGAATQSGLNTIDVNALTLYQQVAIMIIACMCTPIFINGSVVFVRLYWFEKRFQHVVVESRIKGGRTRTMSKRKSEMNAELDRNLGQEERGVGDREIRVVRAHNGHAEGGNIEDEKTFQQRVDGVDDGAGMRNASSSEEELSPHDQPTTPVHPVASNVVWADNLSTPAERERKSHRAQQDSVEIPEDRLPRVDKEKSIAFVQSQRNPTEKAKLRIPGPRDFDRGLVPQQVAENDEHLNRILSRTSQDSYPRRERSSSVPPVMNGDDRPFKHHITIDVPDRPRPTTGASVYNRVKTTDTDTSTPTTDQTLRNRSRSRTFTSFLTSTKEEDEDPIPYLSWTPTIARNSNFVDLTEEQREELGGIEYRALKLLAMILVSYFVGFHLLGMVCLTPWINRNARFRKVVEDVGISPTWWGFFTPASMFNDLGFTLTPDSMVSFQYAVLPLVLGTFLIIIGNTGFPCMLRFVIWLLSKVVPRNSGVWEELRFLLDHPRRCFTLLFPSKANWWLFGVLVLLNGVDLIFFIILDLNDPTVTSLPGGFRFLAGLFQAAATRTAGFAVVNIADLHPAIQVSYLIMMYISIFPIAMSMRQTNVYEEKSLGVWGGEEEDDGTQSSYLSHHLRRQLSFDLWFVFLGFFLIAIIEGSRLENTNEYAFSLFSVLFEIVSAYGTVGLSLGFPGTNTSFSGQFRTLSKLIIIAMQIRGRHRGLPYALDRAILLPSESLHQKENEDATRRARRSSNALDVGMDGITRTGTGLSRRSSISGETGRPTTADRFKPKQLKRILSGAFSAGPTASHREKRA
ncbi:high affinity potassium transport protein [Cucurbitaria berberidis CBS 394.84]|uniref:Potassium transport protein n=1 Tax=Cucurbitaria berberidis CBS 394.84 TaxID=1168544 RepID=A0A9P4GN36_9PLEO|nr:high affinity potassium transport protein [Cucurbitaria berberidis CBS 394.84]KAF1848050.1 high affinity potassium transport protein [Cucurbitaria berberidis CBS 394.84]